MVNLEDEGLQVYTAYSGEEALRRIDAGLTIQACVVDLRLPGISGIETIMAIYSRVPEMYFVIHTGSESEITTTTLQQAGLGRLPVFRKPLVDMSCLAKTLKSGLWLGLKAETWPFRIRIPKRLESS